MKYVGSKNRLSKDLTPIIQSYINKDTKMYIEPFCLSKDCNIYTENGIKTIGDLKVGDYIYDDNLNLKKVINITKNTRNDGIKLKIKGNIDIKCTENHKFYTNEGVEINAIDSLNKTLLIAKENNKKYITHLDLKNQITYSNDTRYGRSGKLIGNDKIKLYHNAPVINRYIKIDENLMFCYGLIVAEGDKGNITMNKNEIDVCKDFINKYLNILELDCNNKIYNIRDNAVQVSIPYKTIYEKIFFKEMNIGYGARNKNISFLFKLPPNLVKIAIKAMITGDGCVRNKGKYRSICYKTSSKTLAHQLQTLLSVKFNIKSTLSHGFNKERMIKNRILKSTDYYNISINKEEDIIKLLSNENSNIFIKKKTKGFYVYDIEKISDEFYDITLESNSSHRYILDGGIITHNCGGANMIDKIQCNKRIGCDLHKQLIELLKYARDYSELIPEAILEDTYKEVKNNKEKYEDWYVGLVGFCASFGAKYFGGYARSFKADGVTPRDMSNEAIRNLKKQAPNLKGIDFYNCSFLDLPKDKINNCVIYCDPPYRDTTKYKTEDFPYEEFYQWCRDMSKNNTVLISEYNMPDDFTCIWEKESKVNFDSNRTSGEDKNKRIEKLYIYSK